MRIKGDHSPGRQAFEHSGDTAQRRAVPKVIDFGIAKATQGELTDITIYTQFQQFVGTRAYMSPEQAEMSGLDIDTRSLGVLLYELLVGKTPFEARELMQAGVDEMRRTIREKEPLRPSTRLSGMVGEELTTTAKRRGVEAVKLIHVLRGDLDWIVMKALEKDRMQMMLPLPPLRASRSSVTPGFFPRRPMAGQWMRRQYSQALGISPDSQRVVKGPPRTRNGVATKRRAVVLAEPRGSGRPTWTRRSLATDGPDNHGSMPSHEPISVEIRISVVLNVQFCPLDLSQEPAG